MRGIKPEFWTDEKVVALSPQARLLFIGMWHLACDYGHVSESPVELKMRIFPMDPLSIEDMRGLVAEIVAQGLIENHDSHLTVPNFEKHQRLDKRYMTRCDHCGTTGGPDGTTRGHDGATRDHAGPPSGHASSHDEREREREREQEPKRARRKAATPAPDSLDLTEDDLAWAREKAPNVDLQEATEEFLTWARSVDKRYADWKAAWRNAMKRAQGFAIRDGRHLQSVPQEATDVHGRSADWMLA